MTANDVHTCPYYELRFNYANDLKDHIVHDHPAHAAAYLTVEIHEMPK